MYCNNVSSPFCYLISCAHSSASKGAGRVDEFWKFPSIQSHLHCWSLPVIPPTVTCCRHMQSRQSVLSSVESGAYSQICKPPNEARSPLQTAASIYPEDPSRSPQQRGQPGSLVLVRLKKAGNCSEHSIR